MRNSEAHRHPDRDDDVAAEPVAATRHLFDAVLRKPFTPELLMTTVQGSLLKTDQSGSERRRPAS